MKLPFRIIVCSILMLAFGVSVLSFGIIGFNQCRQVVPESYEPTEFELALIGLVINPIFILFGGDAIFVFIETVVYLIEWYIKSRKTTEWYVQ